MLLDSNFSWKVYNENDKNIELIFANNGVFKLLGIYKMLLKFWIERMKI